MQARAEMSRLELAKRAAQEAHEKNWLNIYTAGDGFIRRRALIEARGLLDAMELAALAADEAASEYQRLYHQHLAPLKDWFTRKLQTFVEEQSQWFETEGYRLNQRVMNLHAEASANNVVLSPMVWWSEFECENLEFKLREIRKNAGIV